MQRKNAERGAGREAAGFPKGALESFVLLDSFAEQHESIFPSAASARWFIHKHRDALAAAGAIALLRNRLHVHPTRFLRVVERVAVGAAAAPTLTMAEVA